jgi:hypothetical protein
MNEILPGEAVGIWSAEITEDAVAHNGGSVHAFAFEGRKIEIGQAATDTHSPKDQMAFRSKLRLWL